MSAYPDMNKLVFFDTDDDSDCDISDGESDNDYKLTLAKKLINANVIEKDQKFITSILTWSRKDRTDLQKVRSVSFISCICFELINVPFLYPY